VIELDPLTPALLAMAFLTLLSLLPLVNVIRVVAVNTELAQFFLVGVAPMAVQAHQFGMAPYQLELCVLVVIEFHLGPFDKGMAFFAFFAKAPFVIVVTPMAVDTFSF